MLILTRKIDETIRIGPNIRVKVLGIKGHQVRLGIAAPDNIGVHREEVFNRIEEVNRNAEHRDEGGKEEAGNRD